jgi:hypothetical protein
MPIVPLPGLGLAIKMRKKNVKPSPFGQQSGKVRGADKPEAGPSPSPAMPASGADSTQCERRGLPPSIEDASNGERWKEIVLYALISLISFLCGAGVLGLLVWKAELLSRLGLTGNLFYIVLLPMGLAAAGFLFGVVRSYARYSGKQLGGMLELGGPIVAFLLVLILGFVLVKPLTTFPLTVYVHGAGGPQDVVLRNSGDVLLDLAGDRRREPIGADGQAYFPAIPTNFQGQEVPISVDSDTFEVSETKQKLRLDGNSIYLPVQRKAGHLSGWVKDEKGNPIPGATVNVAGLSKVSDSAGYFEFSIPGRQMQGELQLEALAPGYVPVNFNSVVPGANPLTIQLQRRP